MTREEEFRLNQDWLRAEGNQDRYAGLWVALRDGVPIDSAVNRTLLQERLQRQGISLDGSILIVKL